MTIILHLGNTCLKKFNKAYSVLGIIKRNFIYIDEHTFILLYKAMVRPHIEFANSVWCPYKLGDIKEIEKVQKRATKLIIKLKNKLYRDRLFHLNLPTLKYRHLRSDMIEVFKITQVDLLAAQLYWLTRA